MLDFIPTLGDALAGAKPEIATRGPSRVHRIADDPEPEEPRDERGQPVPAITPFIAGGARGELLTAKGDKTMPKGIYKRKPRAAVEAEAAAAPSAEKPASRKRAKKTDEEGRRPPPGAVASFVVDDAGRVSIVPAAGARIDLSIPDTKRLAAFLERTKRFRS